MTLPKSGGTEWAASQASPWNPVNQSMRRLDAALSSWVVVDRDLGSPPGSCADGANYLIASPDSGDWDTRAGQLATAVGTDAANGWLYTTVAVEGNRLYIQDENLDLIYDGAAWTTYVSALTMAAPVTKTGTPVTNSVGFLGAPQISDQDDYTLAFVDSGGHYYHVSGTPHTLTIPANASIAFPIGTVIGIVNENGGGDLTIAITSDTLRWTDQTGSRTLAANGAATLLKVAATVWRLTGDGIT